MKVLVGICFMLVITGGSLGWFLLGGPSGGMLGLVIACLLAVPLYCIVSVFKRNAFALANHPLQDPPVFVKLDPSQLALAAYEPNSSDG